MSINRRQFLSRSAVAIGGFALFSQVRAETYLSIEQAQQLIFPGLNLKPVSVTLGGEQEKQIENASKTTVRNHDLNAWKSDAGDWFIVDQVIGKHENIDLAIGLNGAGEVVGIEILTYRETYGYEVRNAKWRAQFNGRDYQQFLKLDKQIRNISGATLSCRHITDGINRLTQTWHVALRSL